MLIFFLRNIFRVNFCCCGLRIWNSECARFNCHHPNGYFHCHCSILLCQWLKYPIRCCLNYRSIDRMSMVTRRYLQSAAMVVCSELWLEDLTILRRDKRAPNPNKLVESLHFDPIESFWCQSFANDALDVAHSMTIW